MTVQRPPSPASKRPVAKAILAILVILGALPASAQPGGRAPDVVLRLERWAMDDPAHPPVERDTAARRSEAVVRQALGAATLENYDGLGALVQQGLSLASGPADAGERCLLQVVQVLESRHRLGAAAARALALAHTERARQGGQGWCVARLGVVQARIEAEDDRIADALNLLDSARRVFEAAGDAVQLASARNDLMWIYRRDGTDAANLRRAIDLGLEALSGIRADQQRYLAATIHHNLAGAYLTAHELGPAREHVAAARQFASAVGDEKGLAYIGRLHAEIAMADHQPDEALERFREAQRIFHRVADPQMELVVRIQAARALLTLKRVAQARSELASLDALRAQVHSRSQEVEYLDVALDAAQADDDARATAAAAKAYARALRELEMAERRKLATELRERMGVEQREAENRLLLAQQAAAQARQRWLLVTLALSLALAAGLGWHMLQQRRVRRSLKALAETDELTGLPNRRAILETLAQASRALGSGLPTTLGLVDIDFFKRVNDQHGHAVGDAALKAFALACRSQLRGSDAMGRFGGEEFLLVLPGTPLADAQILFERMRNALQHTEVPGLPPEQRLSCSMGCAELPHAGDLNAALARADAALYRAKAAGRDRVELAPSPD